MRCHLFAGTNNTTSQETSSPTSRKIPLILDASTVHFPTENRADSDGQNFSLLPAAKTQVLTTIQVMKVKVKKIIRRKEIEETTTDKDTNEFIRREQQNQTS